MFDFHFQYFSYFVSTRLVYLDIIISIYSYETKNTYVVLFLFIEERGTKKNKKTKGKLICLVNATFFFWPHTRRSACVAHKCIQDSSSSVETPWSNAKPWFSLSFHTKRHTCILVYKMEKRYIMCLVVAYSWSEKESSLLFIVFYRSTWLIFNGKWLTYEKEGITCEKNLIQVNKNPVFCSVFNSCKERSSYMANFGSDDSLFEHWLPFDPPKVYFSRFSSFGGSNLHISVTISRNVNQNNLKCI